MGQIVVFENITLDGVMQDPIGEESAGAFDWRDGLSAAANEEWLQRILHDTRGVQALLFGRRTYEFFAPRYAEGTGPVAELVRDLPKYVVSSTLTDPSWTNTAVLNGDAATEAAKLKANVDGTIMIWASSLLVRELVAHDLVDELRLIVFPLVIGHGARLFSDAADAKRWRLAAAGTVEDLACLTYRR
ncbi:dihydrofolate reductase family protein [Amycolatopsis benzoatilytica]|uniref:dihydrofolate reductase family protein n=1 Tax=Amycolatopsis benzoatilytica TaxID=346045 RepID=UPI0003619A97|nr:dihydrofolate reductase family protein [Amycolatopsis benzoatilytica]